MNFDSYSYELAMHFVKAEETLRLKAYKCPKGGLDYRLGAYRRRQRGRHLHQGAGRCVDSQ